MEEMEFFRGRRLNPAKLADFGFCKSEDGWIYRADIAGGQLRLFVTAEGDGISTRMLDPASGDEYVLHKAIGAVGSFVGEVRAEYEEILGKISAECFEAEVFKSRQAKELIEYAAARYDTSLEFL